MADKRVVTADLAKVSYMIIYMIFDDHHHRVGDHGNDDISNDDDDCFFSQELSQQLQISHVETSARFTSFQFEFEFENQMW